MNFSFRRTVLFLTVGVLLTGIFSACKKDLGTMPEVPAAGLMAFNLAPDLEYAGIALSGNALTNSPLQYTNFNGRYQNIYTGQRDVETYLFGSDSVVASSTFNFEHDNYYSLFVTGNNGVYENIIVKDDVDSTASAEKAYVRYINAVPDSSSPVVTVNSGGTNVLDGAAPFKSVSPFTAVTPGEVAFSIDNGAGISASRNITVEKGKVYTALLIGDPASTDTLRKVQIRYIQNGLVPVPVEK